MSAQQEQRMICAASSQWLRPSTNGKLRWLCVLTDDDTFLNFLMLWRRFYCRFSLFSVSARKQKKETRNLSSWYLAVGSNGKAHFDNTFNRMVSFNLQFTELTKRSCVNFSSKKQTWCNDSSPRFKGNDNTFKNYTTFLHSCLITENHPFCNSTQTACGAPKSSNSSKSKRSKFDPSNNVTNLNILKCLSCDSTFCLPVCFPHRFTWIRWLCRFSNH